MARGRDSRRSTVSRYKIQEVIGGDTGVFVYFRDGVILR